MRNTLWLESDGIISTIYKRIISDEEFKPNIETN